MKYASSFKIQRLKQIAGLKLDLPLKIAVHRLHKVTGNKITANGTGTCPENALAIMIYDLHRHIHSLGRWPFLSFFMVQLALGHHVIGVGTNRALTQMETSVSVAHSDSVIPVYKTLGLFNGGLL